jgi:hypothetical protein
LGRGGVIISVDPGKRRRERNDWTRGGDMKKEELEKIDEQGLSAWDAHDADAFCALFADKFTWTDWSVPDR